jgi:predicted GNAT family acetyltransferase
MTEPPQITVVRNDDKHRYEARIGDVSAGHVDFTERPGVVVLVHTETYPGFEGRGVGSALAVASLDDVRARGLKAAPTCPFIKSYIKRHPEYQDLVADSA